MPETLAQQALKSLATDRAAQYDHLIARLGEDSEISANLAKSRQAAGGSKDAVNPYMEAVATSILTALRGPLAPRTVRDTEPLMFGSVAEESAAAWVEGFDDGSALVRVSDAMLSMCSHLGALNAAYWTRMGIDKPGLRKIWRLAKLARQSEAADPLTTASLRFYLVQQRIFGLAAKRSPELAGQTEDTAAVMGHVAFVFVLAHEAAHFALGHIQGSDAMSGGPGIESDADTFALEIVQAVLSSESVPQASSIALMGAVIGLLATHTAERALFVRPGHSHPPATARLNALARSRPGDMKAIQGAAAALISSVERAGDIAKPIAAEWWAELHSHMHPQFVVEAGADPITKTGALDQWCGQSPDLFRKFLAAEGQPSTAAFAEALVYLDGHDLERALTAIGAKKWMIKTISALDDGLTFNWLLQVVEASEAVGRVDEDRRQAIAITLARCFEANIQGASHA
jgi:hypothetical protein